jgi:hypothetical protein
LRCLRNFLRSRLLSLAGAADVLATGPGDNSAPAFFAVAAPGSFAPLDPLVSALKTEVRPNTSTIATASTSSRRTQ